MTRTLPPEPGVTGQFLRFVIVGGAFALIYAVVAAGWTSLSALPPPLISALVWLGCIPPAFLCQQHFTFRAGRGTGPRRFALYAASQGLSLLIVTAASHLFASRDALADTAVNLGAALAAAVASFALNRFVTFAPAKP